MNDDTRTLLNELADLLDALPPERFNYQRWVGSEWGGDPSLSCGTYACAGGWATTLPSFRARGLHLVGSPWPGDASVVLRLDHGDELYGTDALARVLDIPHEDAAYLFIPEDDREGTREPSPSGYASAREVAAHIRKYLLDTASEG